MIIQNHKSPNRDDRQYTKQPVDIVDLLSPKQIPDTKSDNNCHHQCDHRRLHLHAIPEGKQTCKIPPQGTKDSFTV